MRAAGVGADDTPSPRRASLGGSGGLDGVSVVGRNQGRRSSQEAEGSTPEHPGPGRFFLFPHLTWVSVWRGHPWVP